MKLNIKFVLSKGDGSMPDLGLLPPKKQNKDFLVSCMKFMPAFEDVEDVINSWKLINEGLDQIDLKNGLLVGYPTPIIEVVVNKSIYTERFENEIEFLHSVWESSYRLLIPDINQKDLFYFCDFNGYSHIL